jgi:hypothetical protein
VKYNPEAFESYYHQEWDPEKMVDFHASGKPHFFAPKEYPNIVGKEPPRKPNERALAQDQSSPSSPPLATAGLGHKKPAGQLSSRGTKFRSGDANTESGRVAKRGGDNSPDLAGSAVDGKGTGEAFGNKTIGVNQDAQNSDGNNPNSSSGSDFFADSKKSESGSTGSGSLNGSGESSGSSGANESSMSSRIAGKKSDSEGLNDSTFFDSKPPAEKTDGRIARKPPRESDGTYAGVQNGGTSLNRMPASPLKEPTAQPRKTNKPQVTFEGGV